MTSPAAVTFVTWYPLERGSMRTCQGHAEGLKFDFPGGRGGQKSPPGGRQNRAAQIRKMQFIRQLLQAGGDEEDALWLEGAADARGCGGQLFFEKFARLGRGKTVLERTFEDVRQHESEFLKFRKHSLRRLPFRGDLDGIEDRAGFAPKCGAGSIEKISVEFGGNAAEQ